MWLLTGGDVSDDWTLTWHATMQDDVNVASCCRHPFGRVLCMMMSRLHHADVILIRVSHVGRVNWYSGWVSPAGRRRRVALVYARGQPPRRRVMARTAVFDVRFRRCFHQ
jgi:hypothetical protein